MSTARQVPVTTQSRDLTYIDPRGEVQVLGQVTLEDFENENIRRLIFQPDLSNPWSSTKKNSKGYDLGIGASTLDLINPADIHQTLLERGYQITKQYATSGGSELVTIFADPSQELEDTLTYDREAWGVRKDIATVHPSLMVENSLYVGRFATKVRWGFWRIICTNGLMSKFLEMPLYSYKHQTFNLSQFTDDLARTGMPRFSALPTGPALSSVKAMSSAYSLLSQYLEAKAELPELPRRFQLLEREFSSISYNRVSPWVLTGFMDILKSAIDFRQSSGEIYAMDLVNAYTSAVNLPLSQTGSERGLWSNLAAADHVIETATKFAQYAEIFSN